LVLAVYHEVQYLYFTYAMSGHPASFHVPNRTGIDRAMNSSDSPTSARAGRKFQTEIEHGASFLLWPVIGFVGAVVGGWFELGWLSPLGMGGLFCHYWLDGRIWTQRSSRHKGGSLNPLA
jgi:hypothetical protein